MKDTDDLTESDVRRVVRDEMSGSGRDVLSPVFWTVVSAFAVLVGLQAVQIGLYTTGPAAVAFAAVGILVTGASSYLLYLLHWSDK